MFFLRTASFKMVLLAMSAVLLMDFPNLITGKKTDGQQEGSSGDQTVFYERCYEIAKKDDSASYYYPNCSNNYCKPSYTLNPDWQPFYCYGAPCSIFNEAYLSGLYASAPDDGEDFFWKAKYTPGTGTIVRTEWVDELNQYWSTFKLRRTGTDYEEQIPQLERLPIPNYVEGIPRGYGLKLVPLPCDPRAYLYCELSFRPTYTRESLSNKAPTLPEGRCRCHPLYSREGEQNTFSGDGYSPPKSGSVKPIPQCLGRANTPCKFDRREVGEGQFSHGSPDPLTDRDKLLNPKDLFDDDGGGVQRESMCIKAAKCEYFSNAEERDRFRRGEIWHGFGYNPILRDMMLISATKICKCHAGFRANAMHDCVHETIK